MATGEMVDGGWSFQNAVITDETGRPMRPAWFRTVQRAKSLEWVRAKRGNASYGDTSHHTPPATVENGIESVNGCDKPHNGTGVASPAYGYATGLGSFRGRRAVRVKNGQ